MSNKKSNQNNFYLAMDNIALPVNSPDRNNPLTDLSIVLYPFLRLSGTRNDNSLNATSTGGHFGRCDNVTY